MKKVFILLVMLWAQGMAFGQSPNWAWAKSAGGGGTDYGQSIAVDGNGNTYVAGYYNSATINFGSITLTNAGSYDIYIAKYDANGNLVWVKKAGGIGDDWVRNIALDGSGNTYITGYYNSSTLTFGSTTLTNAGAYGNIFIVKYDINGNVVWAKSAGGNDYDYGQGIAVDGSGNAYITGYYQSTTISFDSISLTNVNASFDIFIAKYDTNGIVVWAKSAGGNSGDNGLNIALDGSGNAYITGSFNSPSIILVSDTLTNANLYHADVLILKYDTNGNIIWAKSAGGSGNDYGKDIAVDGNGNLYVTGYFSSSSISFGNITLTNSYANRDDMFIVKYDSVGNVVWAKSAGGNDYDRGQGIAVDGNGNAYVIGSYTSSSITFGIFTLNWAGPHGIFIVKYDSAGNVVWAKPAGISSADLGWGIAVDGNENTYIIGDYFNTYITFGNTTFTNSGDYDMFVAKLDAVSGIDEFQSENGITIAPNPFSSQTTITFSAEQKNTTIKVMDVVGKEIMNDKLIINGNSATIDMAGYAKGIYFIRIEDEHKNAVNRKVIKN